MQLSPVEAMETLIKRLKQSKSNSDFLKSISDALTEDDLEDIMK
jgi:transcription termination factor Rho